MYLLVELHNVIINEIELHELDELTRFQLIADCKMMSAISGLLQLNNKQKNIPGRQRPSMLGGKYSPLYSSHQRGPGANIWLLYHS
jgi:hypothetical protein